MGRKGRNQATVGRLMGGEGTVSALLSIPHSTTRITASEDIRAMATHVRADLDGRIATAVVENTMQLMGDKVGLSPEMFHMFLEFLGRDPEIQDRFSAYVAARRILG